MLIARPPRPSLRPFVRTVWAIDQWGARRAEAGTREHVLPTGAMHLAFRLSGEPLRVFADDDDAHGRRVGRAVVGGPRSSFYIRDVSTPSCSVGAMLNSGAAPLLFGVDTDELAHRHARLDDLWGRSAGLALEQLLEEADPERRLAILESILASRLPAVCGLHPAVAEALGRFEEFESVRDVVRRSGYSHRHFVTLFRGAVGLTPKLYCRVRRFRKALRRASPGTDASMAAVALEAGYSDQAHFTRDFLEFAGITPTAYRAIAPPLASHVVLPSAGDTGR